MAATPTTIPPATGPQTGAYSGGPVQTVVIPFAEAGAAGVYTGSVVIPARSQVVDVMWTNMALWAAGTSATLAVGDTSNANGYMNAVNVKTTPALAAKAVNASGGTIGAYTGTAFYPTADKITATVTTVGTASSAGRSYLTVMYVPNIPVLAIPTQA